MKRTFVLATLLLAASCCFVRASIDAQSAAPAAAGAQPPRRPGIVAYPDRPKAPQEVLDRGKALFSVNCAFCHGSDAGGGEVGPNLWRSSVVLNDQEGELIAPIVHGARADKGMPKISLEDAQIKEVAAWLHSIHVASRTDPNAEKINIVTGDAKAGQAYFQKTCARCHSVTGDLAGLATRFPDPKRLQQTWLMPGGSTRSVAGVAPAEGLHIPATTATVTLASGEKVEGRLVALDDFMVAVEQKDSTYRTFSRDGETPKVEVHDPLAPHRELLPKYTDKDIHDLTAYLVTIQ
ncbi:MAG TPA: c-type cytochrome [Granulicella sp.]